MRRANSPSFSAFMRENYHRSRRRTRCDLLPQEPVEGADLFVEVRVAGSQVAVDLGVHNLSVRVEIKGLVDLDLNGLRFRNPWRF